MWYSIDASRAQWFVTFRRFILFARGSPLGLELDGTSLQLETLAQRNDALAQDARLQDVRSPSTGCDLERRTALAQGVEAGRRELQLHLTEEPAQRECVLEWVVQVRRKTLDQAVRLLNTALEACDLFEALSFPRCQLHSSHGRKLVPQRLCFYGRTSERRPDMARIGSGTRFRLSKRPAAAIFVGGLPARDLEVDKDVQGGPPPNSRRPSLGAAYLPAALWMAAVLYVGTRPDLPSPPVRLPLDKLAHLGMYGTLGVLSARGWARAGRRPPVVVVLAIGAAAGALDEWNQRQVASRTADPLDWLADLVGVALGFALAAWLMRRSARKARNRNETAPQ